MIQARGRRRTEAIETEGDVAEAPGRSAAASGAGRADWGIVEEAQSEGDAGRLASLVGGAVDGVVRAVVPSVFENWKLRPAH